MESFLRRDARYRGEVYTEASRRLGLQPASVEKDFWFCWTLRTLFAYLRRDHTSRSKAERPCRRDGN